MKKTTILVTGCAGFIGSAFVRSALANKLNVIGIDNFSTGRRDAVHPDITFYEGTITDARLLEKIFTKHSPQYVFHFAAVPRVSYSVEHPRETTEENILGTVALLEASANHKVQRFIFSSSSAVYGGAKVLPTKESENLPNPKSPYAAQKLTGEVFCRIFSELYGVDTVCLRYFNVFGPGQYGDSPYATVISGWLEGLFGGKKELFLEGDGSQSRDFCYIDNVIQANMLAMQSKKPLKGAVMNIAHGERTSLKEMWRMIERLSGKKLSLEKRPSRKGDVKHSFASIALAKRLLGYKPTVSFEEGLERTIEWMEKRYS